MKIAVTYYSRTGNTKHVANILKDKLKDKKIDVDLIEIEGVKKPNFFTAGWAALKQKELPIKNTDFNLKKYNIIIVGSPTWVGRPAPYIKTFFNRCTNIEGKKAFIFVTSAGDISSNNSTNYISEYLESIGLKPNSDPLKLRMRKKVIKEGEKQIDDFLERAVSSD